MNIKLTQITPSQARVMLKPCQGDIGSSMSGDEILKIIKDKNILDKSGNDISAVLTDINSKEDGVIICNLASDDKSAPISEYLVNNHADRLAEGLNLLSKAGNCGELFIYAPKGMDTSRIKEKLINSISVTEKLGQQSLVLRESTALYNEIDNGEIRVNKVELEFNRTFISEGWQGRPTLVVDAETACYTASAVENQQAEATKLIVINAGEAMIAEIKIGTSVDKVLEELSTPWDKPILLGGMLGRFVSADESKENLVAFDWKYDSITVLKGDDCSVKITADLLQQAKSQSCQKCVMCREGSFQLSTLYLGITQGKAKREDIPLIEDIAPLIMQGTICEFGKNMAGLAYSHLLCNKSEMEAHVVKKTCPAGACESFTNFHIDPKLCTGCGDCMDACEFDAIEGKKKFIHIIDQKMCEKCGECQKVCEEDAVVTSKVRVPKRPMRVGTFK